MESLNDELVRLKKEVAVAQYNIWIAMGLLCELIGVLHDELKVMRKVIEVLHDELEEKRK